MSRKGLDKLHRQALRVDILRWTILVVMLCGIAYEIVCMFR